MSDTVPESVVLIAARAFRHRIVITQLLERAGVAGSTWTAWRNGTTTPKEETLLKLMDTLDVLIAERKGGAA